MLIDATGSVPGGVVSGKFDYLIEKIRSAEFSSHPFRHLYLADFFSTEHFATIVESPEVALRKAENDRDLISILYENNFKEINFPGTTTDVPLYLKWHEDRVSTASVNQDMCEGFGVTMRLQKTRPNTLLRELEEFFKSNLFLETLAEKFELNLGEMKPDMGLQKYLDGYEISPHPDIRLKALTYMVNINPAPNSEELDFHTRYMKFKLERQYVREFWDSNASDRCWVPWSWCDVESVQTKNNSIVIFSPGNDTLHAVKASYDHLQTQRTQLYGNLWYKIPKLTAARPAGWHDLDRMTELRVSN